MAGRPAPHKPGTRALFPDTQIPRPQATRRGCSACSRRVSRFASGVEGRSPQAKIAVWGHFNSDFHCFCASFYIPVCS